MPQEMSTVTEGWEEQAPEGVGEQETKERIEAQIDALNALAWEIRMQDVERSIRSGEDAYARAEAAGYVRGMARGLLVRGFHLLLSDVDEALAFLDRSLSLSREAADRPGEAMALNNIGLAHSLRADYAAAMPFYTQALAIRREIGDRAGEATTLNNMGNIFFHYADHSAAVDHLGAALKIYREIGDRQGEGMALNNLGDVHSLLADHAAAYDCRRASLEIYQDEENPGAVATILCSLAEDQYHLSRHDESQENSQRALSLARAAGDARTESEALTRLGLLAQKAGDHAEAQAQYRQALEIARRAPDGDSENLVLYHLGLCSRDTGDLPQAREWLDQAAVLAEKLQEKKRAYEAHEALAGVCARLGDLGGAYEHHRLFHRLEKEVFNEEADRRTKGLMLQMEVEKRQKEAEIYRQRAEMERLRTVELAAANDALHLANARLEGLATTDLLTGLPNHRAMASLLESEVRRARRHGRHFGVLFFDIDHFKSINDFGGHAAGDAALQQFAALVRGRLRAVDFFGRWGGEEFVAVLPETDEAGALVVAEQMCAAVAASVFEIGGELRMTCSIGVAAYRADGQADGAEGGAAGHEALLTAADQAMYAAKRLGRNQVRAAGDPAVGGLLAGDQDSASREDIALAGAVEALTTLARMRDGSSREGAALLAVRLAQALGLTGAEARLIGLAARLHDIGLLALPDVLLQTSAPLGAGEQDLLHTHPQISARVVSHIPGLRTLTPLILAHHERWDGDGYPDGLAGEQIPIGARIIAVADAFCALTSGQSSSQALEPAPALGELRRGAGGRFDPTIVEALAMLISGDGTPLP